MRTINPSEMSNEVYDRWSVLFMSACDWWQESGAIDYRGCAWRTSMQQLITLLDAQ